MGVLGSCISDSLHHCGNVLCYDIEACSSIERRWHDKIMNLISGNGYEIDSSGINLVDFLLLILYLVFCTFLQSEFSKR